MKEYYYCYSTNLHDFLRKRGQRYICVGLNEKTKLKFWQYKQSEEFAKLLAEYSESNPNK